jgi:hypothetical protein
MTSDGDTTGDLEGLAVRYVARCGECGRVFRLDNSLDADEWHHGHDCEA